MDVEEGFNLIKRNTQEIITEQELIKQMDLGLVPLVIQMHME